MRYYYRQPTYNLSTAHMLQFMHWLALHADLSTRHDDRNWSVTKQGGQVIVGFKLREDERFFRRTFRMRHSVEVRQYNLLPPDL